MLHALERRTPCAVRDMRSEDAGNPDHIGKDELFAISVLITCGYELLIPMSVHPGVGNPPWSDPFLRVTITIGNEKLNRGWGVGAAGGSW